MSTEPWIKLSIPLMRTAMKRVGVTKQGKPYIEFYSFNSFKVKLTIEDDQAIARFRDALDEAERLLPKPKKKGKKRG